MRRMNTGRTLLKICAFTLLAFSFPGVGAAQNTCGSMHNQQCVLTVDVLGSAPPSSTVPNVPVEKGKRPGLFLHFFCADQATLQSKSNVCFPMQSTVSTVVQLKIGSNPALTCGTTPGSPGTCSYSIVDHFQNSNTCGPGANQPCKDTVQLVYNGDFTGFTTIQYSASGLQGVGGAGENLANMVQFSTKNDTPSTVSVEFVFDISGSMGWPAVTPPTSTTPTRMQALQFAAQTPFGILNSYALPGDKVGAAFFSTKATPDPTAGTPCGGPGTNLLAADNPTNVNSVSSAVQVQVPTFSTSIGAGLQSADTCGFIPDVPGNTNKTVLLFSDGEQNTPPMVSVSGGQIFLGGNPYDSSIQICPVTAGRLAAPGFMLQQSIADAKCNGSNAHIRDTDQTFASADLQTFFAQALAAILPTDKLELLADSTGIVKRESSTTEKFLGASNDARMTIVLSWSGGSEVDRVLPFQLRAPDGTIIDVANRTTFARNTSFTTLPFPLFQGGPQIAQLGEWQLELRGASLHSPSVNYHLLVVADNPTIISEFHIDATDIGTGEPIPIRVKLTDNGAPVLNATVQAQLEGPQNSQGNVLSNTPTPPPTGPGPDPPSTKGQGKLDSLYTNPANASLFADTSLPTLTLVDQGSTGVYTGALKDTLKEGHYYVSIRVRGKSATAVDIQRAYQMARFVRSKPNTANTVFTLLRSVAQTNGSVLVTLQAIPHDAAGNFLGPGYEKDMQIKSTAGTIEVPLDDKLDGSYEIVYRLPSQSSNPTFTIVILGSTVTTKTLGELQKQPGGGKVAVFFDAGAAVPQGTFGNAFNTGFSLNAGLEYIVTSHFSAEGIFGYHRFTAKVGGGALNLYQFSANGKAYLTSSGPFRPFINAGIGGYDFTPGGGTHFGGNVGAGVLREFGPHWGLQASYNFHAVNTPGAATKFSTIQGGIRFVF